MTDPAAHMGGRVTPASPAQRRLFFLWSLDPESAVYHVAGALSVRGGLDIGRLDAALGALQWRHESLRTTFEERDGDVVQRVHGIEAFDRVRVEAASAAGATHAERDRRARSELLRLAGVPFSLDSGPLWRCHVIESGPNEHLVAFVFHHIVMDEVSSTVFARDLEQAYADPLVFLDAAPAPQYADHCADRGTQPGYADGLAYWKRQLEAVEPPALPEDGSADGADATVGDRVELSLDTEAVQALEDLCDRRGAGAFAGFLAAYLVLLQRWTGMTDLVVGLPVAGRPGPESYGVIGFFSNTVVLRCTVTPDLSFEEVLSRTGDAVYDALEFQDVPFDAVVDAVRPDRESGRNPLFRVSLVYDTSDLAATWALQDLDVTEVPLELDVSHFDLTLGLRRGPHTTGEITYSTARFSRPSMERFAATYETLLRHLCREPGAPIGDVELLSAREREEVLGLGRGPAAGAADPEGPATVWELFEATARAHPDREAIRCGTEQLTFAHVHATAARWARALSAHGVSGDVVVGIRLPRSASLVAMMLAVWRAGGAFVLLEPTQPEERQRILLSDSRAALLVTDTAAPEGAPPCVTVTGLDEAGAAAQGAATDRLPMPRPDALAYVVFTSGSTGRPKGVLVEHGGLVTHATSHLAAMYGQLPPDTPLNVAGLASVSFDVFINQALGMLVFGHRLLMIDEEERQDLPRLVARADDADTAIQILDCSTSQLEALVDHGLLERPHPPRLVVFGGESCSERLWQALRSAPGLHAFNVYGATECTIESTAVHVRDAPHPVAGRATGGTRMYVLDGRQRLLPPTFVGEIHLGGSGVARGYTSTELTADRFVPDPFAGAPGERMYRTGDRGRLRGDGQLEFWGRVDNQVKIRGYRIEPGEVEVVLSRHPGVAQAAVVVHEYVPGDPQLVAYVVAGAGGRVESDEVRGFLAGSLPSYMVPASVIVLDAMPLTVNGKLDRKGLPAPVAVVAGQRAPRTPHEHILCGLFAAVLGRPRVGPDDNFFHLGGHSLLATRLTGRIHSALGTPIPLRTLFEAPTPATLATRLLRHEGPGRPALVPVDRSSQDRPLSYAQQRLWFLNRLEGPSPTYNIPVALRLTGELDGAALAAALRDLVERHATLRTVLPATEGTPHQVVLSAEAACPAPAAVRTTEAELPAVVADAARQGFDLTVDPPLRTHLFQVSPTDHFLLLVLHHIAADGWSMGPLARDLADAYRARLSGNAPSRAPLPVTYADYTLWQRGLLGDSGDPDSLYSRQLDYWSTALEGLPDRLELPFDHPRPARPSHRGGEIAFRIPPELHAQLAVLAGRHNATLFMVLQAGFAALLSRLGAGVDIPIGSPIAGRTDDTLDDLVGFFVNTLVLRTDLTGDVTFDELVTRVRETHLQAHQHQDLPFEQLVDRLNPERALSRHPLFQVMVVFTSEAGTQDALDALELPGLTVTQQTPETGVAKFDLQLDLTETTESDGSPAGIHGTLGYAADLFEERTARDMTARLERLLEAVAADPARPVAAIDVLRPEERERLLAEPTAPYPLDPSLTATRLFVRQAAETPHAPAVTFGDTTLDYAALASRARHLAHRLEALGAGPEEIVALALPRSADLVVAVLAVLMSGAAYLPVDPDYPAERIAYVLGDAGPTCLLTDRATLDRLPHTGTPHLLVDEVDWSAPSDGAHDPAGTEAAPGRPVPGQPHHLAYVIHTSGSTGRPKGVQIEHAQLAAYLAWCRHAYPSLAGSAVLHSSVAFDLTVTTLLGPLVCGGHILVPPPGARPDGAYPDGASFGKATPRHLEFLDAPGELRSPTQEIVIGGEALTGEQLARWRDRNPEVAIVNEYGPTEATVGCVTYRIAPEDPVAPGPVPIGTPIPHTRVLVLDENLRLVPPGVTGDLYLAGAGLARGYRNRPELTAERFVPCPYGAPGERMYRTGDRGRLRGDGQLEFWGRVDDQVKIRGYRIEPGEVEVVLSRHPGVAQAAVVVHEHVPGNPQLVAYVVAEPGGRVQSDEVRGFVAGSLPSYMVPASVVVLDAMPLTVNGKLDRKGLPAPVAVVAGQRAPRTPHEHILCGLFAEVLGRPRVGPDDNFFHLGGHSLLATRLTGRIHNALGTPIPLRTLFEAPTPATLATRLTGGGEDDSLDMLLPLRTAGSRPPLFCVAPASGLSWAYAGLLEHLDSDQPVFGLQAPGLRAAGELPNSVDELAEQYLKAIRSVQGSGPYRLLGWSLGGVLAHELAVRLQEQGETVPLLALLDSYLTPPPQQAHDEETLLRHFAEELGRQDGGGGGGRKEIGAWARRPDGPLASLSEAAVGRVIDTYLHTVRLLGEHRPRVFGGSVHLFTAEADRSAERTERDTDAPASARPYVVGDITTYGIDAPHVEMTARVPLRRIAGHLGPLLGPAADRPN
ncbi:amino acid adenylation domain-containing protein [Streptomyces sp. NPDC090445]|uniref:amino acid adenylation domain-containing protein n=1 Tax=Streptomyces sp. NPDC090445 TaxID=3365963 RepID=UPI0038303653